MTVQPTPHEELLNSPGGRPANHFNETNQDAGPPGTEETYRAEGGLELLVRKIIKQTAEAPGLHIPPEDFDSEVLLDLEVDGVRCLLLRLPVQPDLPPEHAITLSPRELEIARMIAKGYPNKTIAAVLEISAWTVCTHIRRIFAKLGVGSRAAMVARLSEDGALADKNGDERKAGAPRANGTHA